MQTSSERDRVIALGDGRALSAGADGLLKLWELRTGKSLRTLRGHTGEVRAVAATAEGAASIAADGLRRWRADGSEAGPALDLGVDPIALCAHGARAWVMARDGALLAVDLGTMTVSRLTAAAITGALCLAVDPAGKRALVGSADTTLRLIDLERGAELRALRGHSWDVQAVAFHPDGRRALSTSRDKSVKLWDLASGRCLATFARHAGSGAVLASWPDGALLASCPDDKTLELWREDDRVVARWPAEAALTAIALEPGGRMVIGDVAGQVTWLELVTWTGTNPV
ncbi:MAG TPA: hypothetical protein VL172_13070 [Kofleriaceae bacterium]|nr:hypothetical protein [Kofleriaceae bacterium]